MLSEIPVSNHREGIPIHSISKSRALLDKIGKEGEWLLKTAHYQPGPPPRLWLASAKTAKVVEAQYGAALRDEYGKELVIAGEP